MNLKTRIVKCCQELYRSMATTWSCLGRCTYTIAWNSRDIFWKISNNRITDIRNCNYWIKEKHIRVTNTQQWQTLKNSITLTLLSKALRWELYNLSKFLRVTMWLTVTTHERRHLKIDSRTNNYWNKIIYVYHIWYIFWDLSVLNKESTILWTVKLINY